MIVIVVTIGFIAFFAFIEALFAIGIMADSNALLRKKNIKYSVVVAVRNEEEWIESCIQSLFNQSVQPSAIIVVDDHSDDKTFCIVHQMIAQNPLLVLLSCDHDETGKRAALMKGISAAQTEVVLTIDGDCMARRDWALNMLSKFSENKKLVSGPVITLSKRCLNMPEYAESLFLMAVGAGAASQGLMFQASGANMLFLKSDFVDFYKSASGAEFRCGDDVFFLQYIQKQYGRKASGFCSNSGAVVETHSSAGIKEWIFQRVRWASKSRGYSDWIPFAAGILVLFSSSALVAAFILLIAQPEFSFFLLPVILVKVMGDVLLLFSSAFAWKAPVRVLSFFMLPLFYPLFLMSVGSAMIFQKNKIWKGRAIS